LPVATLRVFIALELPAEVKTQLGALSAALQRATPRGCVRWVRPEGIHLTLKFYGEVAPEAALPLHGVAEAAARSADSMAFTLGGVGAFPNLHRPRVIWAGLVGDVDGLRRLQREVEARSQPLGFAPEARGFNPHLTLGRVNQPLRGPDQDALTGALTRVTVEARSPFVVTTLALIRSEFRPGGSVYTTLRAARLGSPIE
jgi:2'-5' RNA ligase